MDSAKAAENESMTKGTEQTGNEQPVNFLSMVKNWFSNIGKGPSTQSAGLISKLDMDGIVDHIKKNNVKNVIVMTGAGISTSAGIPDFRSKSFGLYDRLKPYDLPFPEAIFSIEYFIKKPEAFFAVSKELFGGDKQFEPTPAHHFIRLLNDKGILLRHYTQNVDELETAAGLDKEKNVQAHGTIQTATCLSCNKSYHLDWVREQVMSQTSGVPKCTECQGLVKPDVVLFGESLPAKFYRLKQEDFPRCDLLIIVGTSLAVAPFNHLVNEVPGTCPRLLINLSKVDDHHGSFAYRAMMFAQRIVSGVPPGLKFDGVDKRKIRDVWWQGTCDDGARLLAEKLGWKSDLETLIQLKKKQ